ncbi:3-dehydroquinate synthase [Marinicella rhabdoformis]|uniref:3-dehydroquinate synthase n=1 Tax=Marinicella rhabdoformis TaxID=2580566 RepID=UPI0012AEC6FE|nr:3-dehydroquinate synthase [Marinicella rhabdoformis]
MNKAANKLSDSQQLNINLGDRSYPIIINQQSFDFAAVSDKLNGKKVLLVSNETVAPLYANTVIDALGECDVSLCVLPDGEVHKNSQSWLKVLDDMADHGMSRTDVLVSLGGGVICDMTGFAAASWMRGIDFIQIPTTLLSQIDASVGGKTGINHAKGKNLIGAFHQPLAVIINTDTLNTLPQREFAAGIGEAVKYGGINQPQFIAWLSERQQTIMSKSPEVLVELIAQCCDFKVQVVEQDEKEQGIRALLNLGHTFGHALETATNYEGYLHGEAVALGMIMAAELSAQLGFCDNGLRKTLENLLQGFDLPIKLNKEITADKLVQLMRLDKKVQSGKHRLILMKGLGQAFIETGVEESDLLKAIEACR